MSIITNSNKMEGAEQDSPVLSQEYSNPMLNSVVLQTLFEHASIKEIETYRQVCRLWWEESLPRWRRGVRATLGDYYSCYTLYWDRYLDGISGSPSSDPYQFGKHPYKSFKVNGLTLSLVDEHDVGDRQMEFWSKCGPKMKHLEISESHFHSTRHFEAILFRFVPNLVFLHLNEITFGLPDVESEIDLTDAPPQPQGNGLKQLQLSEYGETFRRLPVTWLRILEQYPRIESVSVANYRLPYPPYSPGEELHEILNAMITLAREQGFWRLEKLDLLLMGALRTAVFESRHSELFRRLQLPLTTLCLHIASETTSAALKVMLETCAYTLRKLMVYRDNLIDMDEEQELEMGFPYGVQLDSLSELWLSGRLLCENLNFLPLTPNLASLILAQDIGTSLLEAGSQVSGDQTWERISQAPLQGDRGGHLHGTGLSVIEDTDFSRLEHLVCSKLKEFILSGREQVTCSPDEVAALSRCMPNLKTLLIGLGNDGFRVACEGWKQLEVLIIQPYEVDQYGLTGNLPLLTHRLPNLSDLSSLRYFGMGFETSGGSKTCLCDESALNAIFPLKNLLGITAVYDEMSEEVRDQLLSKFPHSKLHLNGGSVREWPFEASFNYGSESDGNREEERIADMNDIDVDGDQEEGDGEN